jgi:hypothetical protein
MTPAPGDGGSGSETTRISDSVGYSTKANLASTENALHVKVEVRRLLHAMHH